MCIRDSLLTDMTGTITSSIMYSMKARSRTYRKEVKWFSFPNSPNGVLASYCSILQSIAFNFEDARKVLPGQIFTKVWHSVAEEMGKFIREEGSPSQSSLRLKNVTFSVTPVSTLTQPQPSEQVVPPPVPVRRS